MRRASRRTDRTRSAARGPSGLRAPRVFWAEGPEKSLPMSCNLPGLLRVSNTRRRPASRTEQAHPRAASRGTEVERGRCPPNLLRTVFRAHPVVLVESRMGAVAWGLWPAPRLPSPLIEPDVRSYRIRLSDWLHRKAHSGAGLGRRSRHSTAWFRWIASHVNRRLPRPATLCRLARKARTRSRT